MYAQLVLSTLFLEKAPIQGKVDCLKKTDLSVKECFITTSGFKDCLRLSGQSAESCLGAGEGFRSCYLNTTLSWKNCLKAPKSFDICFQKAGAKTNANDCLTSLVFKRQNNFSYNL